MYVPNYVPEPLEVPGNIADERYPLRLAFIRHMTLLHSTCLVAVAALSCIPLPRSGLPTAIGVMAALLIVLDIVRISMRGTAREARLSAMALPAVLALAAWNVHELMLSDYPAWAVLTGPAFVLMYTLGCGRDFSFIGGGVLALIASSVTIALLASVYTLSHAQAAWALLANGAYLFYYLYDFASMMQRRRRGEELAAEVDLFRDVFNLFGYVVRVISHWRKHRIWNAR